MGMFPQSGNFGWLVSKLWPNLICYATCFIVLWRAWISHYTTSTTNPPNISLQSTAMHSKCTKNALLKMTQNIEFLVHFECIAVHCSELMGVGAELVQWESHALHRTIKKWRNKSGLATASQQSVFLSDTKQAKFPF